MTGVELIAQERQHQIDKHGYTGEHHADNPICYDQDQLLVAAQELITMDQYTPPIGSENYHPPQFWDRRWWLNMCAKNKKERIKIAGALLAAELDRLQAIENKQNNP